MFEKPNHQSTSRLCGNRYLFILGAYYFLYGCLKHDVFVTIKIGAKYSWCSYFVWVLIILILGIMLQT